jgi:hypothetical protein
LRFEHVIDGGNEAEARCFHNRFTETSCLPDEGSSGPDTRLPEQGLSGAPFSSRRDGWTNNLTAMSGMTLSIRWNWQKLFSYGEVVCFVSAWAIGLLVALQGHQAERDETASTTFAAASDSLGIQATLRR